MGAFTLTVLLVWPRVVRRVPAALVALAAAAVVAYGIGRFHPGFDVATIASRFSYAADGAWMAGIPRQPPT
jgi:SulP family sulfate permease